MKFTEKLRRCAVELNKSKAGQAVGLKPNTISTYVATGSIPRADIALKIARALDVPLDWLIDDGQGWPPPKIDREHTAAKLTDQQLLHELGKRFMGAVVDFLEEADRIKTIDWRAATMAAHRAEADSAAPDFVQCAINSLNAVGVKYSRMQQDFDVFQYAITRHAELPGADRQVAEIKKAYTGIGWIEVESMTGVADFAAAIKDRPSWLPTASGRLAQEYGGRAAHFHRLIHSAADEAKTPISRRKTRP